MRGVDSVWSALRAAVEGSNVSEVARLLFELLSRPMEDLYRYASPHNNLFVNVGRDNVVAISVDNIEDGIVHATVYLRNHTTFRVRVDAIHREFHILTLSTC